MNERSLLAAVRADPADDLPRLATADWLDEHDRPDRAEFIRVQVELARIDGDDPRRPDLDQREQELLLACGAEWLKDVPAWARKYAFFHRGFVNRVGVGARTFAAKARGLLAKAPVMSASFSNADRAGLEALAASPHLAGLDGIQLADCEIGAIGALLDSPHATGLRGLAFYTLGHYAARFPDLRPFLDSPRLPTFTRLGFLHIGLGPGDLRGFFDRLAPGRLEQLQLADYDGTDDPVREVAASEALSHLRALGLNHFRGLTDESLRAVARSPHLSNLRRLTLRNMSGVTDEGMQALADSPYLRELTDLDVTSTWVGPAGIRMLAESPNLPRLSRIDLLNASGFDGVVPVRRRVDPANPHTGTVWVRDLRR